MDAINTVLIKRHQSAHNTTTSSATRDEAMATSSALKLQCGLLDKHDKSVMRALWVTRWNSSRDDNYRHRCINFRDASGTNTTTKPGDPLNGKHHADWANSCPWSPTMQALGSTKTKTSSKNKRSHHDTWNARHTCNTRSHVAEWLSDALSIWGRGFISLQNATARVDASCWSG